LAESHLREDLVLFLETPTVPMDAQRIRELLDLLWRSTRRVLVVRGDAEANDALGPSTDLGRSLTEVLRGVAPDAEVYPVDTNGSITTLVALRPPEDTHPRDFTWETLAPLVDRHPDPLSLLILRLDARRSTHFYPDHAPRLWEYPVVAQLITEHLPPGSRLVDVGAGVTPLAPFLTSQGYVVETVDPSAVIRQWPPRPDWNEWDYLDYGEAGLASRSWNTTLDQVPIEPRFDGAYSVSVIEHVPASVRRNLLADISIRTSLGGLVVLTIDLVRGSDDLWNLNLGVVVEEITDHGTLDDVVNECAAVGLELIRTDTVRDWGDTRVDIGLLALRKVAEFSPTPRRGSRQRLRALLRRPRA
jgi:hypothetical protein